jgi:hypothetical protein
MVNWVCRPCQLVIQTRQRQLKQQIVHEEVQLAAQVRIRSFRRFAAKAP